MIPINQKTLKKNIFKTDGGFPELNSNAEASTSRRGGSGTCPKYFGNQGTQPRNGENTTYAAAAKSGTSLNTRGPETNSMSQFQREIRAQQIVDEEVPSTSQSFASVNKNWTPEQIKKIRDSFNNNIRPQLILSLKEFMDNASLVLAITDENIRKIPFPRDQLCALLIEGGYKEKITSIDFHPNKHFIILRFLSSFYREAFKNNHTTLDGRVLVPVDTTKEGTYIGFIRNVSLKMSKQFLSQYLEKYAIVKDYHHENLKSCEEEWHTNVVKFTFSLRPGITLLDIPTIISKGMYPMIISLPGVAPQCITCLGRGHISKNCPNKSCHACRGILGAIHRCGMRNLNGSTATTEDNQESNNQEDMQKISAEIVDLVQVNVHNVGTLQEEGIALNGKSAEAPPNNRRNIDESCAVEASGDTIENKSSTDIYEYATEEKPLQIEKHLNLQDTFVVSNSQDDKLLEMSLSTMLSDVSEEEESLNTMMEKESFTGVKRKINTPSGSEPELSHGEESGEWPEINQSDDEGHGQDSEVGSLSKKTSKAKKQKNSNEESKDDCCEETTITGDKKLTGDDLPSPEEELIDKKEDKNSDISSVEEEEDQENIYHSSSESPNSDHFPKNPPDKKQRGRGRGNRHRRGKH